MDRNLGATSNDINNINSYGNYYWGDNGIGGVSDRTTDRQGPCPEGYHVPSMDEWQGIYETFCNINGFAIVGLNNIAGRIEQFSKTLKLPFAGIDNHRVSPHSIDLRGSWMFYWSSDTYDGHNDIGLNVESPNGERDGLQTGNRGKMTDWLPVRCFKD